MPNYGACLLRKRFDDMSIMARVAKNKQTDDNIFVVLLPAICSLERRARYLFYCMFFLFVRFFVNDFSTTRGSIRDKFCMRAYCGSGCVFSSLGVSGPRGRKKGEMKFSLL